jgi:prepilin-type N-terminal cleavage/methylation domain-containing protein
MRTQQRKKQARGFTLIELLVAIAISVVLLAILAFVFRLSTSATRDANNKVAVTERLRSLNIRLRQEFGAMLPQLRIGPGGKPYPDKRTFEIDPNGRWIVFTSATVENGRAVTTDVKYEFLEDGGDRMKNALVRWRDKTGPYIQNPTTREWTANLDYLLGDNDDGKSWIKPGGGENYFQADAMVTNVRLVQFEAMDVPPGMPGSKQAVNPTQLNPRELPSAIKLTIEFGPEGVEDIVERAVLVFPVYRGL